MATSTEGIAFQANFKTPGGTLFNVYSTNGEEFLEMLEAALHYTPHIAAVESALTGASNAGRGLPLAPPSQQPTPPQHAPVPQGDAPQALPPQPVNSVPLCQHGESMKLIPAGVSRAGRPYRAFYACARPRNEQCDSRVSV